MGTKSNKNHTINAKLFFEYTRQSKCLDLISTGNTVFISYLLRLYRLVSRLENEQQQQQ